MEAGPPCAAALEAGSRGQGPACPVPRGPPPAAAGPSWRGAGPAGSRREPRPPARGGSTPLTGSPRGPALRHSLRSTREFGGLGHSVRAGQFQGWCFAGESHNKTEKQGAGTWEDVSRWAKGPLRGQGGFGGRPDRGGVRRGVGVCWVSLWPTQRAEVREGQ